MSLRFESCESRPLQELQTAMNDAFADYLVPLQLTPAQFRLMLRQRGFDPALSWVALENDRPVAVWLVAAAPPRAYVILAGTLPNQRGRGLARRLHGQVTARLREHGIATLQLEVIRDNLPALNLYRALGFREVRALNCHDLAPELLPPKTDSATERFPLTALAELPGEFRDWQPTWQNDDRAAVRLGDDCLALGLRDGSGWLGYGLLIQPTACLAQLAVRPDRRRRGLGRTLLGALAQRVGAETLHLLNSEAADAGYRAFLESLGARPTFGQIEMVQDLR